MTENLNYKMNDEDRIRELKPINLNGINIDNDRLTIYAIGVLEEKEIESTFDKIVVSTFKLFPERFSLLGFIEYPDGKRVSDALLHCAYKTKAWLIGNTQSGYKISEKGKSYLEQTKRILNKELELSKKYETQTKRKEKNFIDSLKKTLAYTKYINKKENEIKANEITDFLRIPKYPNKSNFEKNLKKYLSYAKVLRDKSVEDFLEFIDKNKNKFI